MKKLQNHPFLKQIAIPPLFLDTSCFDPNSLLSSYHHHSCHCIHVLFSNYFSSRKFKKMLPLKLKSCSTVWNHWNLLFVISQMLINRQTVKVCFFSFFWTFLSSLSLSCVYYSLHFTSPHICLSIFFSFSLFSQLSLIPLPPSPPTILQNSKAINKPMLTF